MISRPTQVWCRRIRTGDSISSAPPPPPPPSGPFTTSFGRRGDRPAPLTPYTWAEKFESFERINSIRETNGNFDSCNSCKRLGTSRLHELHESKFPFVSRIEFIRSKLSNFSAHVGIRGHSVGTGQSAVSMPGIRHRPHLLRQLISAAGGKNYRDALGSLPPQPPAATWPRLHEQRKTKV